MRTFLAECLIAASNVMGFAAQHAIAAFTLLCTLATTGLFVLATHSLAGAAWGVLAGLLVAFLGLMLLGEPGRETPAQLVHATFAEAALFAQANIAAFEADVKKARERGSVLVFVVILLASLAGNAILWHRVGVEHDAGVTLAEQLKVQGEETKKCNASIAGYEQAAFDRGKAAEKQRAADEAAAKPHRARASKILSTPPTQPGNDCGSALDRARDWLKNRSLQ